MVALEAVHRGMVRERLGRAPAHWSAPQVRALLALETTPAPDFRRQHEALRAVAEMQPAGDVTAEAWWQLGLVTDARQPAAKLAALRRAVDAAPDDSPRLGLYFFSYARELGPVTDSGDLPALGRQTIRRATRADTQGWVAAAVVSDLTRRGRPAEAVKTFEELARNYPAAATSDTALLNYARALLNANRQADAIRAYRQVQATGRPGPRQTAAKELQVIEGGGL
jgi:tetratricopeptide (TPR) repeat protein